MFSDSEFEEVFDEDYEKYQKLRDKGFSIIDNTTKEEFEKWLVLDEMRTAEAQLNRLKEEQFVQITSSLSTVIPKLREDNVVTNDSFYQQIDEAM